MVCSLAPTLRRPPRRHRASQNIDPAINNKTLVSFRCFRQWMVDGQTGLRGHRVVPHAEMGHSRERGNVPIHRLPTAEQDVRETPQWSDSAI